MSDSKKNRTSFEMKIGQSKQANDKSSDEARPQQHKPDDGPFCMAILGDFSGREQQHRLEPETVGKRRMVEVDRDNLEELMAKFEIKLRLKMDNGAAAVIEIPVKELEDFHPDQLYENVEVFSQLRQLRNRLKNNRTFADAVQEMQGWLVTEKKPASKPDTDKPVDLDAALSTENLLDSVFDASRNTATDSGSTSGSAMVDDLVKQIVAPYVEPGPDPRKEKMLASVDQAISAHMQYILHHPDFQALEAAWLQLDFLVSRIETGSKVKLYLLDISRQELEADLAEDEVSQSGLYKRFCDPAPGDQAWGLILGNYQFDDRIEDILLLLQLGAIGRQAAAPFMAAAKETLVGCESFAVTPDVDDWNYNMEPKVQEAWSMLCQSDEAEYLGLVVPGFLLRSPYGKKSKPIDAFQFEEMPETHCHSCYLWGNGAFIKAEQMARAFIKKGWQMTPEEEYQTDNMPLHHYLDDGEMLTKPCAEILLTERGGLRILAQGLIPLWTVKNSDSIRSSDFNTLN